jgi:glutaminase
MKRENIPHILAAMSMAGLYDASGGWPDFPAEGAVGASSESFPFHPVPFSPP